MNVLLTTGADGTVTVHKDTCKKIADRETLTLEAQLEKDPQKIVIAKKATCCRPSDAVIEDVEQAAWDAMEAASDEEADTDDGEDLIGEVDVTEDILGVVGTETSELVVKEKPAVKKVATKVAKELAEKRVLDGVEALNKVADYLDIDLGKSPKFPGFGKAFKTAAKQSIYINSKGSADARATDAAQADEWAALDHVERRSGNYVRISFGSL